MVATVKSLLCFCSVVLALFVVWLYVNYDGNYYFMKSGIALVPGGFLYECFIDADAGYAPLANTVYLIYEKLPYGRTACWRSFTALKLLDKDLLFYTRHLYETAATLSSIVENIQISYNYTSKALTYIAHNVTLLTVDRVGVSPEHQQQIDPTLIILLDYGGDSEEFCEPKYSVIEYYIRDFWHIYNFWKNKMFSWYIPLCINIWTAHILTALFCWFPEG